MTAIQAFKSKLIAGNVCAFRAPSWCPNLVKRTVITVNNKKVSFTHPTKPGESWLDFPKASEITEYSPFSFVIIHSDDTERKNPLYYSFDPAVIESIEGGAK